MKNILFALCLVISVPLPAQYYYNDITGTQEISNRMKAFVAARVQSVTATGYDQKGEKTTDFSEWQEVRDNGTVLKVTSRNGQQASRVYYTFDKNVRLINTRDSSGDIQSVTEYKYDEKGYVVSIKSSTQDAGQDFNETEERQWTYNSGGKPEKLLRIINGTDSIEYRFTLDEKGNVADEQPVRRRVGIDPVYYYYDDQNRVTDIVRFDKYANQLLPEVMFEYDESNRIIQRITTLSTRPPDYLIWRYVFNEKGLKTKEALFSKAKALKGRIDYAYTFLP